MAQRGEDVRVAMKKVMESKQKRKDSLIDDIRPKVARAFLEMWQYLDTFKKNQEPMEYKMIENIFGSLDRQKLVEAFRVVEIGNGK